MSNFNFSATLIFRSQNSDLQYICDCLGMEPKRRWIKGQPRTTPKGSQLAGVYDESRCGFDLELGEGEEPCDLLTRVTDKLYSDENVIKQVTEEGGSVECYVTWSVGRDIILLFDDRLLSKMGEMKINLGVEAFEFDVSPAIKRGVLNGAEYWTGITPEGDIITTKLDGTAADHGSYKNYLP